MENFDLNLSVEFNEVVNDAKMIVREARHMETSDWVMEWLNNTFVKFMDDVNFKVDFVDNAETYLREKMLDAMDVIKDIITDKVLNTDDRKVLNSVYDVIKTFYFE